MKITIKGRNEEPKVRVGDFMVDTTGRIRRIIKVAVNKYTFLIEDESAIVVGTWNSPQEMYERYKDKDTYIPQEKAHLILGE